MGYLAKYIEERYPRYFVSKGSEGKANLGSSDGYITFIPEQEALWIEKERDAVLDMLIKVCYALNEVAPERFKEIYYNGGN